jgi:hypothetical protein
VKDNNGCKAQCIESGQWPTGPGGCFFGPYGIGNDAEFRAALRHQRML